MDLELTIDRVVNLHGTDCCRCDGDETGARDGTGDELRTGGAGFWGLELNLQMKLGMKIRLEVGLGIWLSFLICWGVFFLWMPSAHLFIYYQLRRCCNFCFSDHNSCQEIWCCCDSISNRTASVTLFISFLKKNNKCKHL